MLCYTYIAYLVPFNACICTYALQWPVGAPVWLPPFGWCSVVRQEHNYGVFEHMVPLECLYNPAHRLVQLWDHSWNITVIESFALLGCWRSLVIGYRSFTFGLTDFWGWNRYTVPKRQQPTTNQRHATSQKREGFSSTVAGLKHRCIVS